MEKETMILMGETYKVTKRVLTNQYESWKREYEESIDDFRIDLYQKYGYKIFQLIDIKVNERSVNSHENYLEDIPTEILDELNIDKQTFKKED